MEYSNLPATISDLDESIIPLPLAVNEAGVLVVKEFRKKCQVFVNALNQLPPSDSLTETPDGKALSILISHIEMTLDEMFFGLWDTVNFKWQVIANEIVGSIVLKVTHPVTNKKIRRTGAAAVQIMVDAVPDELKYNAGDTKEQAAKRKKERNQWALDPDNKKSNALDKEFPKLKTECIKNAAQSLGKLFGRDLNRPRSDNYKPLLRGEQQPAKPADNGKSEAVIQNTKEAIKKASAKTI